MKKKNKLDRLNWMEMILRDLEWSQKVNWKKKSMSFIYLHSKKHYFVSLVLR